MNKKAGVKKFRKLSIASLVNGILVFVLVIPLFFILHLISLVVKTFISQSHHIILILVIYIICFSLPAIICGSIDLHRIGSGSYSNKGKGLDIAGIVLGTSFILLILLFILNSYQVFKS